MIAFSCQDIRKSETVKMNTFQKNKSMQIERSKSTCRFENHLTKDQQKHTNFICQKIIKKFRLISKLNLGWLVNLIYVNFWPKFQSVNQQIYVNFDISKITNLRDSRRRWDRPLGKAHFATVKCQLIQQFETIQVNSISEMNAAVQFALARSSGHSEGCHHIRLLQPRVNAVRQILHNGMPNRDRLGFTKFHFQLFFSSFCS